MASNVLVVCIEVRITFFVGTGCVSKTDSFLLKFFPATKMTKPFSGSVFGGEKDYKHREKILVKHFLKKSLRHSEKN